MSAMMKVKGTRHHVLFMEENLGSGATGIVVRGRHRKKGELCAIKLVNKNSKYGDVAVIERELQILTAVPSHDNIVKFIGAERETYSNDMCIVMELCGGGSLYSILENPKNYYGLEEEDVMLVVECLARGLYHLWLHGIVHRDVKPGNILLSLTSDGRRMYKLTDFGAAKEDSGGGFESLWGTEEYMDPSMYGHAVNGANNKRTFTSNVDLWSASVTIYQCASGKLPYRPSVGVRKDRPKMVKLTTDRQPGVISRTETTAGEIIESTELPPWCKLNRGLQEIVVQLIAGLQERNAARRWSVSTFWKECENIFARSKVNVFNVETREHLGVYVDKTSVSYRRLEEEIARQTNMAAVNQELLYSGVRLQDYGGRSGGPDRIPKTTKQEPVLLVARKADPDARVVTRLIPDLTLTADGTLQQDVRVAREIAGNIEYMGWVNREKHLTDRLWTTGMTNVKHNLEVSMREIELATELCRNSLTQFVTPLWEVLNDKLYAMPTTSLPEGLRNKPASMDTYVRGLRRKGDNIGSVGRYKRQKMDEIKWPTTDEEGCCGPGECERGLQHYAAESTLIYDQFKNDKNLELPHNAMEIHKYNSSHLKKYRRKALAALESCQSQVVPASTDLQESVENIRNHIERQHDWGRDFWAEQKQLVVHQCQLVPRFLQAFKKMASDQAKDSGYTGSNVLVPGSCESDVDSSQYSNLQIAQIHASSGSDLAASSDTLSSSRYSIVSKVSDNRTSSGGAFKRSDANRTPTPLDNPPEANHSVVTSPVFSNGDRPRHYRVSRDHHDNNASGTELMAPVGRPLPDLPSSAVGHDVAATKRGEQKPRVDGRYREHVVDEHVAAASTARTSSLTCNSYNSNMESARQELGTMSLKYKPDAHTKVHDRKSEPHTDGDTFVPSIHSGINGFADSLTHRSALAAEPMEGCRPKDVRRNSTDIRSKSRDGQVRHEGQVDVASSNETRNGRSEDSGFPTQTYRSVTKSKYQPVTSEVIETDEGFPASGLPAGEGGLLLHGRGPPRKAVGGVFGRSRRGR